MEKEEYELILLRWETKEIKTTEGCQATEGGRDNLQIKEIRFAMANMELKEKKLREQLVEVKSWTQVMARPSIHWSIWLKRK